MKFNNLKNLEVNGISNSKNQPSYFTLCISYLLYHSGFLVRDSIFKNTYLLLVLLALLACEKQIPTNYDHLYHSLQQQFRGQLHFLYSLDKTNFHYIQDNPYFNYQDLPQPAKEGVNCFTQLRFQTINQQLQYQSAFDEERLQNDLSLLLEEYIKTRPIPVQTTPCLQPCWQSNFHCIAQEMLQLTIYGINNPNGEFFRSTFKTLNTLTCNQAFTTCSEACDDG